MVDGLSLSLSGGEKLKAHLAKLQGETGTLRAGILEGSTYPDGTPTAVVAAANEFGTATIPPRPFMRSTVQKDGAVWAKGFAKLVVDMGYAYPKALALLGEKVVGDIKVSITTWSDPANSASTVRQKGFNSPLRDTGHLLRSVDSEVKE